VNNRALKIAAGSAALVLSFLSLAAFHNPNAIVKLPAISQTTAQPRMLALPPPQYDIPYTGNLTILRYATMEDFHTVCGKLDDAVACMKRPAGTNGRLNNCIIHIGPDRLFTSMGHNFASVLRHELGHCNGWGANHESMRMIPETTAITMPTLPAYVAMMSAIKGIAVVDR
jgi:hypothetical protein